MDKYKLFLASSKIVVYNVNKKKKGGNNSCGGNISFRDNIGTGTPYTTHNLPPDVQK